VKKKILTMLVLLPLIFLPGCDLLDRLLPPPEPECPYSDAVCTLTERLDRIDLGSLPDVFECTRGCFED
jgi:hypothetical protein